jgi:ABC-type glycerol-3-phosphate transport system substrate-binding protein
VALVASLAGCVFPVVRAARAANSNNDTLVVVSQTGAAPDKALPKALKAFETANPGLTTKLVLYPEEKFVAMYTAAQTAGEQVDLLNLNGQDLRRYATSNALLSFDSISYKERFIPEALVPYTVNGHLWGLPAGAAGGFVVFTNRALLERLGLKVPSTYDELKQVGDALRAKGFSAFTHPGKQPVTGPSNERSKFFPVKESLRILMSSKHSTSSSASPVTSYSVQEYLDWISRTHKASSKPEKPASICSTTLSRKACTMPRVNNSNSISC